MDNANNIKREVNPKQNANILSTATFFYTIPIFIKGYNKGFEENDIYQTLNEFKSEKLGNKVEKLWNEEVLKTSQSKKEPSLIKVLIRAFGLEYFLMAVMLAINELFVRPAQALILGRLILYYMPTEDNLQKSKLEAYFCAIGIVFFTIIKMVLFHPYMAYAQLVGFKVKIGCCSLIYRKALKLNNAAFNQTNVGQMVNLLSNDALLFVRCAMMMNYVWIGPLQCIVITYLMYRDVGFSSIFGVLVLFLFIPIYYWMGKMGSKYRLKVASCTDGRVCYMNEIILGIKVIKMYAWEKPIQYVLFSLRKLEMKNLRFSTYIKATYLTFDILIIPVILYVTILVYVLHNDIRADKVFSLTIFYNSLRLCMATFFPQGLGLLAETLVSVRRIQKFILNSEVKLEQNISNLGSVAIQIIDGTVKWKSEIILNHINVTVKQGCLIVVTGPVGCGKSSIISVMLRELPLITGEMQIKGKVSYASQDPWLFDGTVRDNILFGEKMDIARYDEVVRRCALESDFKLLPYGDNTLVGGRGSTLSGGQKARINLARAVYRDVDIYLLDEPFSAVDSRVGKQIFENCIKDFLTGKTVVLVTHQLKYLSDVDEVVAIENGTIQSEGKWTESNRLATIMDEDDPVTSECIKQDFVDDKIDKVQQIVKEQKSSGTISKNIYTSYVVLGGNTVFIALIVFLLIVTQTLLSGGSYFLSHWVNRAQIEYTYEKQNNMTVNNSGDFSIMEDFQAHSREMYVSIYSVITATVIIISLVRSYAFYTLCLQSSKKLHNNMFMKVIRATMHFFNTNSQGRIINRFSQDLGSVDSLLPTVAIDTTQLLLSSAASFLLIAIVNFWLLIPTIVIGTITCYLKRYCLTTTRDIKRLEGVTRSPVFEHLSSSLQGLNTIRAFQAEEKLKKVFDSHQDLHSCCFHIFVTTSQGFGYFLDCICCVYLAIVILSFVIFDNGVLGGDVGLAITQCLTVTGYLQWAILQTASLENNMTCVERILEYNSIDQEVECENGVRASWPENGEIVFDNVCLRYSPHDFPVLKNLNLKIGSKEKIGIVGRTGAGKSSIVNALFRLSYVSGNIVIDGTDITKLNLQELRSKISIIPQDPVIFSGTLRYNLDPFEEWDDNTLWDALEDVELKMVVTAFPLGLHTVMNQGGTNVSVGQRQLICLARAILRNNKILVLDEATTNVDSETDALIQRTIRKKFEDCTVLTIAHRIDTIMDSDKILVMSAGEVIEYDKPSELLQNVNGLLYQMVHIGNENGSKTE